MNTALKYEAVFCIFPVKMVSFLNILWAFQTKVLPHYFSMVFFVNEAYIPLWIDSKVAKKRRGVSDFHSFLFVNLSRVLRENFW